MRNVGNKLLIFCLLLFVIGVSGLVWLFAKQQSFSVSLQTVREERTFLQPIKALNLSTDTMDVLLGASGQSAAIVRLVGQAAESQRQGLQFESEWSPDGTLHVTVREPMPTPLFFTARGHLQVEVLLPPAIYERILAQTETGDVRASAIQAKLGSISTKTGDVDLDGFLGGQLSVDTKTGDIKLLQIQSPVKVESDTGDINQLGLPELAHDIDIRTKTGDVRISADKKPAAARLDLGSDTGDIEVQWPQVTFGEKEEHHVKASIGSGGPLLSVKTATGDIRIQ